jgi:hypothetical protein
MFSFAFSLFRIIVDDKFNISDSINIVLPDKFFSKTTIIINIRFKLSTLLIIDELYYYYYYYYYYYALMPYF